MNTLECMKAASAMAVSSKREWLICTWHILVTPWEKHCPGRSPTHLHFAPGQDWFQMWEASARKGLENGVEMKNPSGHLSVDDRWGRYFQVTNELAGSLDGVQSSRCLTGRKDPAETAWLPPRTENRGEFGVLLVIQKYQKPRQGYSGAELKSVLKTSS